MDINWALSESGRVVLSLYVNRLYLGLLVLPAAVFTTVCAVLRYHIFIWTVFAPRLIYLIAFHTFFLPSIFFFGMLRR
ncbi:unnamed protein product [Protopolystoma xenopodis]|uniref:GPI ethanolamine phosphate transferase 2 C-terminal domain-containing protein n=1 Tax=Protopolystoma xenopodis TaxID=117903 RepID=A0A448X0R7_9PLAT|nr:unnamed protein product [Protopolystoma xenopodis]